ncbi:MAG: hypothetical protein RI903_354 [Bacteroidota bacterium]
MAPYEIIEHSDALRIQVSEAGIVLLDAQQATSATLAWGSSTKAESLFWEKNQIKKAHIKNIRVEIIHGLFLLIPSEYDVPMYRIGFLEKALGEHTMMGQEVHEQAIGYVKSSLVFLVSSQWKDYLAIQFPLASIQYQHVMGTLLEKNNAQKSHQLSIQLFKNQAFVVLCKDYTLQLNNVFDYQSGIELAFYLHSIREAFDFPWDTQKIQISGPEASNEKLLAELQEYHISFHP